MRQTKMLAVQMQEIRRLSKKFHEFIEETNEDKSKARRAASSKSKREAKNAEQARNAEQGRNEQALSGSSRNLMASGRSVTKGRQNVTRGSTPASMTPLPAATSLLPPIGQAKKRPDMYGGLDV